VAGICVDTSALGRVVLGEPDAQTIRATLAQFDPWFASELLVVELRRLGRREGVLPQAERTLAAVNLVPLTRALLERASHGSTRSRSARSTRSTSAPRSTSTTRVRSPGAHVRPATAGRMSAPRDRRRSASGLTKQSNLPSNIAGIARKRWIGGRNRNPRVGGSSPSGITSSGIEECL